MWGLAKKVIKAQIPRKVNHLFGAPIAGWSFRSQLVPNDSASSARREINIRSSMENVSKVWLGPLPADSPYVKPFRMYYVQNGKEKNWDLLKVHDSVAIILYNTSRQKLVLVRQFRPAVYHGVISSALGNFDQVDLQKFPPSIGVTLELCAGIVDKEKSWAEIAREEVLEECGYDVTVERIEEVMVYR